MAKLERVYNIPLRNEWLKAPSYKRAKRAISAVRAFLMHHMKSETIKIGRQLNLAVWERGIKHPPHHIKVTAIKYDDGVVRAELVGFPVEEPKKEEKKGKLETLKEKVTGKPVKKEEKTEEKKAETAAEKPKRTRAKKTAEPKQEEVPVQPAQ